MLICKTTKAEVDEQGFKPEAHTVSFEDDGQYYCVKDGDKIIATCCMRKKKYGLQMDELYTLPEYRHHGVMTRLIQYVCDELYKGKQIHAHCLESSKNIVEKCGFKLKNVVNFKYGTQWRMIREGEQVR